MTTSAGISSRTTPPAATRGCARSVAPVGSASSWASSVHLSAARIIRIAATPGRLGSRAEGEEVAETTLGTDPESGFEVTLKKGPFGHYVQLGAANGETKPKRVALTRSLKPPEVDLETALRLLALPRELGRHPETGEVITAGIGRFGPYIKHGSTYKSLTAEDDVLTIGANRAVVLLAEPAAERRRGAPQPLRELGRHPEGGVVALFQGRYGPYVSHEGVFASLPREANPETFSLEQAIPLLDERRKNRSAASANLQNAARQSQKPPRKPRRASRRKRRPPHLLDSVCREGETARSRQRQSGRHPQRRLSEKEGCRWPSGNKTAAPRGHSAGLNGAVAADLSEQTKAYERSAALGERDHRFHPRKSVGGRQTRDRACLQSYSQ